MPPERPATAGRARARHEQPHRIVALRRGESGGVLRGKLQRPQPQGALALDAERLLAGGQDAYLGRGGQQRLGLARRGTDQVFAIIEHQQQIALAKRCGEALAGPAPRTTL